AVGLRLWEGTAVAGASGFRYKGPPSSAFRRVSSASGDDLLAISTGRCFRGTPSDSLLSQRVGLQSLQGGLHPVVRVGPVSFHGASRFSRSRPVPLLPLVPTAILPSTSGEFWIFLSSTRPISSASGKGILPRRAISSPTFRSFCS